MPTQEEAWSGFFFDDDGMDGMSREFLDELWLIDEIFSIVERVKDMVARAQGGHFSRYTI